MDDERWTCALRSLNRQSKTHMHGPVTPSSPLSVVGSRVIKSNGDEGTRGRLMNLPANSVSWRRQMTRSLSLPCLL